MSRTEQPQPFEAALDKLEVCLETPFVPGELERWFEDLQQAVAALDELLRPQFQEVHERQLEEIFEQDPGLQHRVEQIRREDARVAAQFDLLAQRVGTMAKSASKAGPDEASLKEDCYKLVEDGLAFVIAARKQQVAVRTWLVEAFDRDCGTMD